MNAAECFVEENHGSRQLGAQAAAEADVHLPVPSLWALPLLRGDGPHDSFRFSVRRGEFLAADGHVAVWRRPRLGSVAARRRPGQITLE